MDGNHTPGALDAELLEEGCSDDRFGFHEGIRIEKGAAEDAHTDNAEAASEDLGAVAYRCAAGHSAKVGDDLCYGYGVRAKFELVGKHGWVEVWDFVRISVAIVGAEAIECINGLV